MWVCDYRNTFSAVYAALSAHLGIIWVEHNDDAVVNHTDDILPVAFGYLRSQHWPDPYGDQQAGLRCVGTGHNLGMHAKTWFTSVRTRRSCYQLVYYTINAFQDIRVDGLAGPRQVLSRCIRRKPARFDCQHFHASLADLHIIHTRMTLYASIGQLSRVFNSAELHPPCPASSPADLLNSPQQHIVAILLMHATHAVGGTCCWVCVANLATGHSHQQVDQSMSLETRRALENGHRSVKTALLQQLAHREVATIWEVRGLVHIVRAYCTQLLLAQPRTVWGSCGWPSLPCSLVCPQGQNVIIEPAPPSTKASNTRSACLVRTAATAAAYASHESIR